MSSVGNLPATGFRWTIETACREFGINSALLRKRLNAVHERADREDHCYSTEQLIKAIYGSIQGERLREVKERADNLSLKNASLRGDLLDRQELAKALEPIFLAVKQLVAASALPKEVRDDLLSTIATYPLTVAHVAAKQRKQLSTKDDDGEEEGDAEEAEVEEVEYQV